MADLRRSLAINFAASTGVSLMQFALNVVLARLLSPSEIGVFSMAVVFVNIAHIFRDFGVGSYLQREPELTPQKVRSAIGVLFVSSWAVASSLFIASSWMAVWLKEPQVEPLIRVLAVGFLFIPFGSVTNSMLVREFAADKQAIINIAGMTGYCVSCLVFALVGMGTMSLAYANLVNVLVTALMSIPYRPKGVPWLPSFRHWRMVTNYGIGALLSNCVTTVNNAVPDILLGKIGNARAVGLLSRANSTVSLFSYVAGTTVTYGALSYMSQTHHRGESLAPTLSRANALLTGVGWPALALTAVLGHDIVLALYGEKWLSCVPAMLPMTIAAGVGMMFHYIPTALMAIGRPYLGSVSVAVTMLARIAFGMAIFNGSLASFAWAICIATIVATPVTAIQQRRHLGFGMRATLASVWPSAQVSVLCIGAALLMRMCLPPSLAGWPVLCLLLAPLALTWYVGLRLTRHELVGEVHRMLDKIKTQIRQLRPASSN
jgi:O-antigen/teichoic acid export membrane protein